MNPSPLIIAHRGASADAPENTFAAFRRALEIGADGVEFDVRSSKDRVPVVIHDSTLKRLAQSERRVADLTAAELSETDVGSWFNRAFPRRANARFAAETVPTFAALLEFLRDYPGLIYVELKSESSAIFALAETVCDLIRQTNLLPNIVVKSFNLETVKIVKRILPAVRTAALFEPKISVLMQKKKRILDEAARCEADELSLHRSLATKKFVRLAQENDFPVAIWTADNPVWVKRALDYGIKAIITNDPARLSIKRNEYISESIKAVR